MKETDNSLFSPETLTIAKSEKVICDYMGKLVANNAIIQDISSAYSKVPLEVRIGITKIKLKGREDSSKLVKFITKLIEKQGTLLTLIWVDGANMNVSVHDLVDILEDKEIIFVWRNEYYHRKVSIVFGENSITLDINFDFDELKNKEIITIIGGR